MSIWFENVSLEAVNARGKGTMVEHLGIVFTEMGEDFLKATMPVDHRTKQPAGLLHGGASVALAETIASTAGNLRVDRTKEMCVGLEINANHIKSMTEGLVTGVSKALHTGRTTQVWETVITQGDQLVCISRMTLAVIPRKSTVKVDHV